MWLDNIKRAAFDATSLKSEEKAQYGTFKVSQITTDEALARDCFIWLLLKPAILWFFSLFF